MLHRSVKVIMILLSLIMTNAANPILLPPSHEASATTRMLSLVGFASSGWNNTPANPTITIAQGDSLVIATSSGDGAPHHFFVDVDKDSSNPMTPLCSVDKCASVIPPPHTDTLSGFVAGNYTYYCEYHAAMHGLFVVQQPPPDFSIELNPTVLTVNPGSSQVSTITVTSLNGFSGNVTFSLPSTPNGITVEFNSNPVLVTATPAITSLNAAVASSTPSGSYIVSVTGSSRGIAHVANLAVVAETGSTLVPLVSRELLSLLVGVMTILLASVLLYVVRRRRRRNG